MSNPSEDPNASSYLLLDCLPLPVRILVQSDNGTPVYQWCNRAALANAGSSADEIYGKSAQDLFPGEWGEIATQHHRDVFQSGKPLTYTHKMPLTAGIRTLKTTLVPVSLNEDDVLHIVASTIDITEQQNSESEWLKAATINQEIREFSALTAHDLQASLRQISAFVDIIKEDFLDLGDGKLATIDMIQAISARASMLVSQLLKTSSDIASSVSTIETFEMTTLCAEMFSLLDPLRYHKLTNDSALITADRTAIQIVLRNLIDNALKHNYPNVVSVHISVESNAAVEGRLNFSVIDDGKGIENPVDMKQDAGVDASEGGYGLPAIKKLLQSRGGVISTEAYVAGKGATVTFVIPGTCK